MPGTRRSGTVGERQALAVQDDDELTRQLHAAVAEEARRITLAVERHFGRPVDELTPAEVVDLLARVLVPMGVELVERHMVRIAAS